MMFSARPPFMGKPTPHPRRRFPPHRAAVLVPCPSYPWPSQAAFEQARRGRLWVTRPDPTSGRVVHYERRMVSRQTTLQRGYGHAGLVP